MSSLNSIMDIGVSGLRTAQNQLNIVSDNITNVNTPGYIRKVANQVSMTSNGVGAGVTTGQVTLSADKYLQAAAFKAQSASSQSDASYNLLNQIQAQFGDPTDANNLFGQASSALTSMAQAAESPTSNATRQEVISNLSSFLNEGSRISDQIQTVRQNADTQINNDVKSINDLLKNISDLNSTISAATVSGGDATGAQTTQTQYINDLSKLIDVNVSTNSNGGVTVRTQSGMMLTGDNYVTLSYQPASTVTPTTSFSPIIVTGANGEKRDLADNISSGELKGLMDVRDTTSVAVGDQLNQYMSKFASQLNAAHNSNSAVPAPASLTGKQLNLTEDEAVTGMTGQTNLVTLDASGNITHTMNIDFDTGQYSLDGGAPGTFSTGTFDSDITAGFNGNATVSFTNGKLSVAATGGNTGIAVVDPAANAAASPPVVPSSKLGQGFSQYFGLNDLITSDVPTTFQTGLTATSNSGFNPGDTVGFALKSPAGGNLGNVSFTIPSGGTMTDLVTALNDTATGVGRYGTFSLDQNGTLSFQGFGTPANKLTITSDTTSRLGTGGASFTQFFGLSGTTSTIANHLSVNPTIDNDPSKLALAQVNLNTSGGQAALLPGDGSGGQLMSTIASQSTTFAKAGLSGGGTSTLARYGSDLAGQVGNLAANAKTTNDSNTALLTEANARRSSTEGVNLDEELVKLTTYQQAYSASGRLIQASKDMFDVLMKMN